MESGRKPAGNRPESGRNPAGIRPDGRSGGRAVGRAAGFCFLEKHVPGLLNMPKCKKSVKIIKKCVYIDFNSFYTHFVSVCTCFGVSGLDF